MKTYKEILEAKFSAKDIVSAYKNKEDWGSDAKDQAYVKKGNLVYIDSYWADSEKSLNSLIKSWKKGGHNYEYWIENGAKSIKVVDSFIEVKASGKHKKLSNDGIIGVELKIG
jgi:hypothetical protein